MGVFFLESMLKIVPLFVFLFTFHIGFSQYDAECFINAKKEIKLSIENLPIDSMRFQDTLTINNVRRYVDTMFAVRNVDVNPHIQKVVGCRMPDFNFFNLSGADMSINKIKSDFTIISFSSITYGDVCNARLHQFCKLKTLLKDSLTVINIFEDNDKKVLDYSLNYESNVEFVANADLLFHHYGLQVGSVIYVIDKYKNIIFVKTGHKYNYTPDEIYAELLEKIRATTCSD